MLTVHPNGKFISYLLLLKCYTLRRFTLNPKANPLSYLYVAFHADRKFHVTLRPIRGPLAIISSIKSDRHPCVMLPLWNKDKWP